MRGVMTGAALKDIREALRLTQKQFAEKMGYAGPNAERTIRAYENGERPVPKRLAVAAQQARHIQWLKETPHAKQNEEEEG